MNLTTTHASPIASRLSPDYLIVTLLASGLAEIAQRRRGTTHTGHRRHRAPYRPKPLPHPWREASARLWWHYRKAGCAPPSDDFALLELCRTPFGKWEVPLNLMVLDLQSSLLDGDELTDLAVEAARSDTRDPGARFAEEQAYEALVAAAEVNGTSEVDVQRNYVELRRYLIENPVVTDHQLRRLMRRFPSSNDNGVQAAVRGLVDAAYERHSAGGSSVRLRCCVDCGNPVLTGTDRCGTAGCRGEIYDNIIHPMELYYVQNRGVRKYIHDAGRLDIRLHDTLRLEIPDRIVLELWPGRDAFDLRVAFLHPEQPDPTRPVEVWGADGKDRAAPGLLGATFRWKPGPACDRRFLVLPEHRVRQPGYTADLGTALEGRHAGVEVIGEEAFMRKVVTRWTEINIR